nr:phage/plasmid primase, P4 family [Rubrivivax sp.]
MTALPAALEPLRARSAWVLWKRETVNGRATKIPYVDHKRKAKSDDPATWAPFDKLPAGNGFAGPGLMLGGALQGVDLDACVGADGVLEPWADEIVARLDSYTEVSPSGRGLKVFMYGPAGKSTEVSFGEPVLIAPGEHKRREVAYFTGRRFFTVTGRVWRDVPVRTISADDAAWLRERVEQLRQAERERRTGAAPAPSRSAPPTRSRPSSALPAELLRLVRDGATEGRRSEQFHHAVRWCADCGLDAGRIVALLEQYPEGIGAKYAGRLQAEVDRSLQGYTPKRAAPPTAKGHGEAKAAPSTSADLADFADPVAAAWSIVAVLYTDAGLRVLHYWQGEFHWWAKSHYVVLPLADVRETLYRVGAAVSAKPIKKRAVDDVLDALKAAANLSHRAVPAVPAWIDRQAGEPDPRSVIPVRNGLVNVDTGALLEATPRLFVPYALPFNYTPDAAPPVAWFEFLASVWGNDQESIDTLQEWLGYLLTADTSQQKALMIVGPRRSGKGTIGRVIVQLLGAHNVASPTLASLGTNFGLEPLIGKTAALMSDARLGARADIAAIAENLLRITGEDAVSVDRKFLKAYESRLLARFVVLTNEMPVFRDAASALPSRFVVLRTDKSFYGREDHTLDAKLAAELPGILVWALAGLRRLRERGRFIQPAAAAAHLRLMEDLASPISAFVRDECIVEPGAQVPIKKLYETWREWCK